MDWSAATTILCEDADLLQFESNALAWVQSSQGGGKKYRDKAKDLIEQRLRFSFRSIAATLDSGVDVLDLLLSVSPLKDTACYLTLHLICNDASTGGDFWAQKGEMYWNKYMTEWATAFGLLSLDIDQSGVIESSEMYNIPGITFQRGD
jgi:hypothetical protein